MNFLQGLSDVSNFLSQGINNIGIGNFGGGINDGTISSSEPAVPDLSSPFDFNLKSVILSDSSGSSSLDLTAYLVELNYYEDIFGDCISGKVVLSDSVGVIFQSRMNGTEKLTISFTSGTNTGKPDLIQHSFRVYSISGRHFDIGGNFENYTINFCSEEMLLSEKYRISKSYKQKTISDMINDIMKNYLLTNKKLNIDSTTGIYDIVVPNKKLFETINWLAYYAQSTSYTGADMLFYESNSGYYFKSLQSLYTQSPNFAYAYNPANIVPTNSDAFNNEVLTIMKLDILNTFDTLKATTKGTFTNRLITIDPILRKKYINDFNYNDYQSSSRKLNEHDVTNNSDNGSRPSYYDRMGQSLYTIGNSIVEAGPLNLMVTNSNQQAQSPTISQNAGSVVSDFFVERTAKYRNAQLALSNYTRIKIMVPGNSAITVGTVLDIDVFGADVESMESTAPGKRKEDSYLSGNYLVTAVRHVINLNRYITVVELAKESNRNTGKG